MDLEDCQRQSDGKEGGRAKRLYLGDYLRAYVGNIYMFSDVYEHCVCCAIAVRSGLRAITNS